MDKPVMDTANERWGEIDEMGAEEQALRLARLSAKPGERARGKRFAVGGGYSRAVFDGVVKP